MSSRLSCWLHGHDWLPVGEKKWEDMFGNLWKMQYCDQCNASRRILHKSFEERL